LAQDYAGLPDNDRRFRAMIQPEYFQWIGTAAWVLPSSGDNDRLVIDLRWNNLPKGWTLAHSFGVATPRQVFGINYGALRHAIFVGGDFRIHTEELDGKKIYTAVRGQWNYSDTEFATMVRDVIATERRFWHTDEQDFLVTMVPLAEPPGATSMAGTGLSNAFALFNTPNVKLEQMQGLLAHEYFHTWNPGRLGRMPEPEQSVYWFSEGFTDFYASLLLLRAGRTSLEDYVAQQNELLKKTYLSSAATLPNERVIKDFWNDRDIEKLHYQRGALLAAEWNGQIRAASGGKASLDNVLFDLRAGAHDGQGKWKTLNAQRIAEALLPYTGQDASTQIRKHIEDGVLIVPSAAAIGPRVEVVWRQVPRFELGLDFEALKDSRIDGVTAGSAAYKAGLRNGQSVLRRKPIYLNDSDKQIEITVKNREGERTVRYFPRSTATMSVPQFKLPSSLDAEQRNEILAWLGVPTQTVTP
jgi:predicted metalloprotease with PDZ domain